MEIIKLDFVEGAREAEGIAVIIDVFRAFSVACYCFNNGARRIIPVGRIEEALALKSQIAESVLIGERDGRKLPGFDFGNSPSELESVDFNSKTIIHTTHAGTQGLVNAGRAVEVLTGAFVNAKATVRYIKSRSPDQVTLVRMGWQATTPTDEDSLCADYLESLLLDKEFAEDTIESDLQASSCSARFFDPEQPWSPISDFELCLKINAFDFAVKAISESDGSLSLRKV